MLVVVATFREILTSELRRAERRSAESNSNEESLQVKG